MIDDDFDEEYTEEDDQFSPVFGYATYGPEIIQADLEWETAREIHKGRVKTLKDMTAEEISWAEAYYGCKVK